MKTFAIALYENDAESEDELNFKKNDLLQILQYDYLGMEGWWLCKLVKTNLIGLAAGNRLKIVNDEKILSRVNSMLNQKSTNSNNSSSNNTPNKTNNTNSIISASSSSSSILSSSSYSNSTLSSFNSNVSSNVSSPTSSNETNKNIAQPAQTSTVEESQDISNNLNTRLQTLSLQPQSKLVLPAKMNTLKNNNKSNATSSTSLTESTENIINSKTNLKKATRNSEMSNIEDKNENEEEDEDYDYDIPENNKPALDLLKQSSNNQTIPQLSIESKDENDARKSTSPTIDSGISTSSLVSLNSDNLVINQSLSTSSSTDDAKSNTKSLKLEYENCLEKLSTNCSRIKSESTKLADEEVKENLINLKSNLEEFIAKVLKNLKQDHACFHPDLNVFNKFKTTYRQLKDFYLFYENNLNSLDKVYNWNFDLILKNSKNNNFSNEYYEIITKIPYLLTSIEIINKLVKENHVFNYHSETSLSYLALNKSNDQEQKDSSRNNLDEHDYSYEYDNNDPVVNQEDGSHDYEDYEQIYENDYDYSVNDNHKKEVKNETVVNSEKLAKIIKTETKSNATMCMTLKKNEEKIRREIRLATNTTDNEANRINLCDQMLLKFYLKHIEENLSEVKLIYDILIDKLNAKYFIFNEANDDSAKLNDLAHKLALNGHKLLFICDTLQRNLNNKNLKQSLVESSNELCDALKLYMIRIKSQNATGASASSAASTLTKTNESNTIKQNQLISDSLLNVLNSADDFKKIILKYYFKSY